MIKNYKNAILGFWIFILPFLGLPLSFKFALVSISGLILLYFSIEINLSKRLALKTKKVRKIKNKEIPLDSISVLDSKENNSDRPSF